MVAGALHARGFPQRLLPGTQDILNRLPLILLAAKCHEDADKLRAAAHIAEKSAERLEWVVCFGTDADVSEALRLVEAESPTHGSSIQTRN